MAGKCFAYQLIDASEERGQSFPDPVGAEMRVVFPQECAANSVVEAQ
jgi:hypothetical protein